ncbi:DNA-binding transcriptional regulator, MerR family [Lachnospiraceae bacterium XBB1006]|nr:DNA-binding transcriptional regulator, MerR family [Lachnospiraceae bacterium XBB1006]
MKIGEFAKKHDVTVDTVRHYIYEGLLTPLRKNTQYDFSEIDDQVMDTILLLKSMNFKLEEMRGYLLFQSMCSGKALAYLGSFRKLFEEKLKENKRIIRENKTVTGTGIFGWKKRRRGKIAATIFRCMAECLSF